MNPYLAYLNEKLMVEIVRVRIKVASTLDITPEKMVKTKTYYVNKTILFQTRPF